MTGVLLYLQNNHRSSGFLDCRTLSRGSRHLLHNTTLTHLGVDVLAQGKHNFLVCSLLFVCGFCWQWRHRAVVCRTISHSWNLRVEMKICDVDGDTFLHTHERIFCLFVFFLRLLVTLIWALTFLALPLEFVVVSTDQFGVCSSLS